MARTMTSPITRRTFLAAATTVTAAIGLAGCNSQAAPAKGAKSLSLQLFGPNQTLVDWLTKTALPKFNKQHGTSVEIRQTDWGSSFQKMLTGAASGTLADVTMMGQAQTAALAAKHAFLSLDDYVADWADKKNFYPAMYKNGAYEGHQYAIPFIADTRTAVYRNDLLKQAGASTSTLPTDWDEYRQLATSIKKAKVPKLSVAAYWAQDNSVGLMQSFSQLLYQAGGTFFDSSGRSVLSSEHGVAALTYMTSFFKSGLSNAGIVYNGSGATPLTQGAAAMTFTGYSGKQNAEQFNPSIASDVVAGTPLAAEKGGKPATIAWINKMGISAKSKSPDLAWDLLSFLVSKDNAAKFDEYLGGMPARTDLGDSKYLKDAGQALVDAAQYAGALPPNPNLLDIQQKINVGVQQAIRGQASPHSILSGLDKTIDKINGKN